MTQSSPRKDALKAGRPTYKGVPCVKCMNEVKHTKSRQCVKCHPNQDGMGRRKSGSRPGPKRPVATDANVVMDMAISIMHQRVMSV